MKLSAYREALVIALLWCCAIGGAWANGLFSSGGQAQFLDAADVFKLQEVRRQGNRWEADGQIAAAYYVYRHSLKLVDAQGRAVNLDLPAGTLKHDEFFGDTEIYTGNALRLRFPATAAGPLTLHWQGCAEAGICYPPQTMQVKVPVGASDTVIAGALVTGIKSDLPGDVIATVTEPVYDTATGKFLLIPQGSRILGKYNSQVSYGQSRVQVVWNRIILPDTSSLKLDNLAGTDPAGYAGLEDGGDWHWDRVFAGAALTTLLGVGAELAAPQNRQDGNRVIIAGQRSLQDSVNQVGQEMTRRNMNIQPTLTERPGLPVRIVANRDLVLRPYQPMFFNR